ncbi:hypothetical protein A3J43_02120 [Candidatus Uhrbacteria bacterium RIFCSPHIGHO2_12_FULL_54_23]|uniref:Uncharacterized protein n=2 Tax=Candidatus Uhriibacteriota TaxID=1752732 RepID=A0A1F7UMB0_9BACT|nr:MAG: hypothetical protein A3J43_02120 [Candidatus Uhrbacteria bacterium RIFCSPHIGHO2_12_FULL_54_23]OGL90124.1 MAG: hypothetical protein A3J36_02350 [Candidatus Uhrbacteria bacterium RIFCSPLOWO2_02_FULL_54_37]
MKKMHSETIEFEPNNNHEMGTNRLDQLLKTDGKLEQILSSCKHFGQIVTVLVAELLITIACTSGGKARAKWTDEKGNIETVEVETEGRYAQPPDASDLRKLKREKTVGDITEEAGNKLEGWPLAYVAMGAINGAGGTFGFRDFPSLGMFSEGEMRKAHMAMWASYERFKKRGFYFNDQWYDGAPPGRQLTNQEWLDVPPARD